MFTKRVTCSKRSCFLFQTSKKRSKTAALASQPKNIAVVVMGRVSAVKPGNAGSFANFKSKNTGKTCHPGKAMDAIKTPTPPRSRRTFSSINHVADVVRSDCSSSDVSAFCARRCIRLIRGVTLTGIMLMSNTKPMEIATKKPMISHLDSHFEVPTVFFLGAISSMQFIQRWVDPTERWIFIGDRKKWRCYSHSGLMSFFFECWKESTHFHLPSREWLKRNCRAFLCAKMMGFLLKQTVAQYGLYQEGKVLSSNGINIRINET